MNKLDELPQGWAWGTIANTGEYINGFAFKPSHRTDKGLPIIRIQNLTDESKITNKTDHNIDDIYKVDNGSLLVSWSGTLDAFIWRKGQAFVNQHIFKVVPETELIDDRLLFYWLKIAIEDLQKTEHLHGSTMKHINRGPFLAHKLPIPPRQEQTRIVEKLGELLSDLENGIGELKTAQTKLAQYRQLLLKSAAEGALTADWRESNAGKVTETGEQFLTKILKERRLRWEESQLEEFKIKDTTPPPNWKKKYPEPVRPNTSDLPELPAGWVWASLSQLGWLDRGRSKYRPRNAKHLYGGPYPFVQTGDIRGADTFISSSLNSYSEAGLAQSRLWPKGTMCITIAANIGETAILQIDACFPDSIVGFLPAIPDLDVELIELLFRTIRSKLDADAPATAQKNINLEILSKTVLPLAPFLEQENILRSTKEGLADIIRKEDAIKISLQNAEIQRRNILKDAFLGKLVEQRSEDEPAIVSLEKIELKRAKFSELPKPKLQKKLHTTMMKLDELSLAIWMEQKNITTFNFADLEGEFGRDYDLLKDALFELLAEKDPIIEQMFHSKTDGIRFNRIKP